MLAAARRATLHRVFMAFPLQSLMSQSALRDIWFMFRAWRKPEVSTHSRATGLQAILLLLASYNNIKDIWAVFLCVAKTCVIATLWAASLG